MFEGAVVRVAEIVRGLGIGGIEVSLARRLQYRPADAWTAVISTQPKLDTLSDEISAHSDVLIDMETQRWDYRTLIAQIRRVQPDVVVSHIPLETVKVLMSALPGEVPVVVVAHHPKSSERPWAEGLISASLRRVNHKAALHIAVSTAAAEGSQCRGARRVEVLPLGAALSDAAPDHSLWPADCSVRLLSLGRLRAFKNLDNLLRGVSLASPTMRHHKAFLAIVGDGSERDRLAAIIRQQGLSDVVKMHPATPDPSGILRATDVFVTVSTSEGGPITAIEALLAGSRLATTRTGLYADLAAGHPQVTPIDNTHPEAIASSLERAVLEGAVSTRERTENSESAEQWSSEVSSTNFYAALRAVAIADEF